MGATLGRLTRFLGWLRLSPGGAVVADLMVCLSLTPSLLPRTWLVQGLVSGVSGVVGYALGVGGGWAWRRTISGRLGLSARVRRWLRGSVFVAAAGLLGLSVYYGSLWQSELHVLLGESRPTRVGYLRVLLVTIVVVAAAIGLARTVRGLVRLTTQLLKSRLPTRPAAAVSGITVGLVMLLVVDGVFHDGFLSVALAASAATNEAVATTAVIPASATRSGSPDSFVSWDSLGREGRSFVSGGPSLTQLRAYTGGPATEPIRVYVGVKSTPSIEQAAALAVRELERTNAGSRAVLCVVTTTGTGWIDPFAAAALEYLTGGDSAIVGVQYSYLPSWITFLNQRDRVVRAGRALFGQVYAYWSALPPTRRPRLLVYGESLGSLGSESAFGGLAEVMSRTDGALWVGPTNDNPLWAPLVADRDTGSPEILPVYDHGRTVRFASRPQDLELFGAPWPAPRVVYLQNASDPVTWWSPSLLFARPDWLAERRGYDVSPAMRWYPVLTFLQVTADLVLAQRTRTTHGHYFRGATVAAWAAILKPAGWTPDRTTHLTQLLNGSPPSSF
ncbi:MAG: alpha/beta hydrolase [Micromonosporaceae bacterium]